MDQTSSGHAGCSKAVERRFMETAGCPLSSLQFIEEQSSASEQSVHLATSHRLM